MPHPPICPTTGSIPSCSFPFLSVPHTLKGKPVGGDDGVATDKKGKKPSKAKLAMEAAKAKKEQERNAKQQAASSEASEKATGGGGGGGSAGAGAGGGGSGSANSNAILSEKDLLAEVKTFTEDQVWKSRLYCCHSSGSANATATATFTGTAIITH